MMQIEVNVAEDVKWKKRTARQTIIIIMQRKPRERERVVGKRKHLW